MIGETSPGQQRHISRWRGKLFLSLAAASLLCILAAGCGGSAQAGPPPSKIPVSVGFGISGGNMIPWTVDIRPNGTVVARGKVHKVKGINPRLLRSLEAAARTDGFFKWSSKLGKPLSPDSGQIYLRIGQKMVYEHGSKHSVQFDELLAIMRGASRIKYCSDVPC